MTYLIENVEQVNTCPNLDFDLDDLGDLPHDYSEEWSMVLWVNIPWEINERKGGLWAFQIVITKVNEVKHDCSSVNGFDGVR